MKHDPRQKAWEARLSEEADRLNREAKIADPASAADAVHEIAELIWRLRGAHVTEVQLLRLYEVEDAIRTIVRELDL